MGLSRREFLRRAGLIGLAASLPASFLTAQVERKATPAKDSYLAYVHPDVVQDIVSLPEFVPVKQYAGRGALEGEIGHVDGFRFITSEASGSDPFAMRTYLTSPDGRETYATSQPMRLADFQRVRQTFGRHRG